MLMLSRSVVRSRLYICIRNAASRHLPTFKMQTIISKLYVHHQIKWTNAANERNSFCIGIQVFVIGMNHDYTHTCVWSWKCNDMIWLRNVNFHRKRKKNKQQKTEKRKNNRCHMCATKEEKWFYAWNIFTLAVIPRDTPTVCVVLCCRLMHACSTSMTFDSVALAPSEYHHRRPCADYDWNKTKYTHTHTHTHTEQKNTEYQYL